MHCNCTKQFQSCFEVVFAKAQQVAWQFTNCIGIVCILCNAKSVGTHKPKMHVLSFQLVLASGCFGDFETCVGRNGRNSNHGVVSLLICMKKPMWPFCQNWVAGGSCCSDGPGWSCFVRRRNRRRKNSRTVTLRFFLFLEEFTATIQRAFWRDKYGVTGHFTYFWALLRKIL